MVGSTMERYRVATTLGIDSLSLPGLPDGGYNSTWGPGSGIPNYKHQQEMSQREER